MSKRFRTISENICGSNISNNDIYSFYKTNLCSKWEYSKSNFEQTDLSLSSNGQIFIYFFVINFYKFIIIIINH